MSQPGELRVFKFHGSHICVTRSNTDVKQSLTNMYSCQAITTVHQNSLNVFFIPEWWNQLAAVINWFHRIPLQRCQTGTSICRYQSLGQHIVQQKPVRYKMNHQGFTSIIFTCIIQNLTTLLQSTLEMFHWYQRGAVGQVQNCHYGISWWKILTCVLLSSLFNPFPGW